MDELSIPNPVNDRRLDIFNFENRAEIRVMQDAEGNPQFVAVDVCQALGIDDVSSAISRLDTDEKGTVTIRTPGGTQKVLYVTESGLYSLILTSRKKQAKIFKRWITHDVIPSVRKSGSYSLQPKSLAELALIHAQALVDHENRVSQLESGHEAHDQRIAQLEAHIQPEPDEHTVLGYCSLRHINISLRDAQIAGQKARRLSDANGMPVGKASDPRFGQVNTYKDVVLDEVFRGYQP